MTYFLNEVLSITAQEYMFLLRSVVQVQFLNEVLSITAQECVPVVTRCLDGRVSSMKS